MSPSDEVDITLMADMIEAMVPAFNSAPRNGYERRVMRLTVEDEKENDDGGLFVDEIEFKPGEPEALIAALRAYQVSSI